MTPNVQLIIVTHVYISRLKRYDESTAHRSSGTIKGVNAAIHPPTLTKIVQSAITVFVSNRGIFKTSNTVEGEQQSSARN